MMLGVMESQHAVVWTRSSAPDRFVGKLTLEDDDVILEGTTTTPERRRGCVRIPRSQIDGASTERVGRETAIRLIAADSVYLVQPLTGGRGSALSLVAQLAR
jgi:hypothetical protein